MSAMIQELAAAIATQPLPITSATAATVALIFQARPIRLRKPRRPVSAASIRLQWHGGRTIGVAR
jgi:hypothetical protein